MLSHVRTSTAPPSTAAYRIVNIDGSVTHTLKVTKNPLSIAQHLTQLLPDSPLTSL